ncbi:MAG: peptide chain release factor N(5)-glutamine methyltransferase [Cyanobacteria bacterium P01_A01_bin.105]
MPFVAGDALNNWRQWAISQANAHSVDPEEVDWLLQGVSDLGRSALRSGRYPTSLDLRFSLAALTAKWQQRVQDRVPVQYLAGETPWRDLMLTVTPAVLVPRPETELIIDLVQQRIQASPHSHQLETGIWVDMGTGSGAIAIAIARALPQATILAVDSSADALTVAQQNAARYPTETPIQFLQGSWFEAIPIHQTLAGVVTNPPYIPTATVNTLDPEVQHEPRQALDGGKDGLTDIRTLAQAALNHLEPGGLWLTELMLGQADAVATLLTELGYGQVKQHTDLANIQRFVSAYRQ